jgi:hypothetical protein
MGFYANRCRALPRRAVFMSRIVKSTTKTFAAKGGTKA